jgi:predicted transcriptional regulator
VHEALVEDSSPGLINLEDVTRAVADGKINQEVKEIMTRGFLTIDSNEPIYEAIKMLGRTGADQLVVSEDSVLWGIVTPNDIVKSLTPA